MLPQPLLLLLLLLLLQPTRGSTLACAKLTCFADYLQTLTCTWGEGPHPFRTTSYSLVAKWNCGAGGTCHLLPICTNATPVQFACMAEQKLCFGENTFDVTAMEAVGELPGTPKECRKTFLFQTNIQPQPPFNVTAVASPSGYNISWKTPYQHQQYSPLNGHLRYQLRYRKRGHSWQEHRQKHLLQDVGALWLLPQEFEGDTVYELQVRAQPAPSYWGTWSQWSSPATFTTLPKTPNSQGDQGGISKWLVLLSLFPALLAFLGQRLWKKLDLFVPSPAPFFQPMYGGHKGDFKKWVGIPDTGATLDAFERGPGARPETFGTARIQLLPLNPGDAECTGTAQAALPGMSMTLLPVAKSYEGAMHEQPYGSLSINTVTVAGGAVPCCPQCDHHPGAHCATEQPQQDKKEWEEAGMRDASPRIRFKGSAWDRQIPGTLLLEEGEPENNWILPPSPSRLSHSLLDTHTAALPPFWQVGSSLSKESGEGSLFFFGPSLLSSLPPPPECCPLNPGSHFAPEQETPFYSTLLSHHLEADDEGDLDSGLDLDTIDSGFAECDSRSPLDSECEAKPVESTGMEENEAFLPSYVKQWLSGHGLKAGGRSQS